MTGQYNATAPTITSGQNAELQLGARGALKIQITDADSTNQVASGSLPADALAASTVGMYVNSRSLVFNGSTFDREVKPNLTARLLSAAASTNATSVKASAGNLHKIVGTQVNAAARYLKLYNKASAPTVGTDTPVWTFYLPPTAVGGGLFTLDFGTQPLYFSTGIAYALTTAAADADTGALTAGDVIAMNIAYS
jgi:hypothetical protein